MEKHIKEKEKENIRYNKRKSEHISKANKIKDIKNHLSDKNVSYKDILPKNEIEIKSQRLSGVFTKINNLCLCEELDINDISISNNTKNNTNKNENEINKNHNHYSLPKK